MVDKVQSFVFKKSTFHDKILTSGVPPVALEEFSGTAPTKMAIMLFRKKKNWTIAIQDQRVMMDWDMKPMMMPKNPPLHLNQVVTLRNVHFYAMRRLKWSMEGM